MNDLKLSTVTPVNLAPAPGVVGAPPSQEVAEAQAPQRPVDPRKKPDLVHRQASAELADVWGGVAGKNPRKTTYGSTKPEGNNVGTAQMPGSPPPDPTPPAEQQSSKAPASAPQEESRAVAAATSEVKSAAQTATEAPAEKAADTSAKVETQARQAATQQGAVAREEGQVKEARAQHQQDTSRVAQKEQEVDRREREVDSREHRLGELRSAVESRSREVQDLRLRERQKESELARIDTDINTFSSGSDYLEHADEVERLRTVRSYTKFELDQQAAARRQAESDLREAERQAAEMEVSVYEGKRSVANERWQVTQEKGQLQTRRSELDNRQSRVDQSRRDLGAIEELRPFWAALRDESGLEGVADEAAAHTADISARDTTARRRILSNASALSDPKASLDLIQGGDPTHATASELALASMQLPLEKAR